MDVSSFIDGMRQVPSVVTVVTVGNQVNIWGITIGSFVSLSIDPPLVCFNVQHSAAIHDAIKNADEYIVHVLREDQTKLSDHFARADLSVADHFRGLEYDLTEAGSPVLQDTLVTFYCQRYDVLPGGDHSILVGRVVDVKHGTQGRPIVYLRRAYFGIGSHLADHD